MKMLEKKSFIAGFVMLLLILSPISAETGKVEVNIAADPYCLQIIDYKGFDSINSQYGISGKAGARYFVLDSLFVGAEAGFESYFLKDFSSNYNSIKVSAVLGYRYNINEALYCQASVFPQLVIDIFDGDAKPYFGAGAQILAGLDVTENIGLELGVDFGIHWENHKTDAKSAYLMNLGIPVGIKIAF